MSSTVVAAQTVCSNSSNPGRLAAGSGCRVGDCGHPPMYSPVTALTVPFSMPSHCEIPAVVTGS